MASRRETEPFAGAGGGAVSAHADAAAGRAVDPSGKLHNARLAVAVIERGMLKEQERELRWDVAFPTLYQIRQIGLSVTPIAFATAHMAALFVRHFPRELAGVFAPEALPSETRQAIVAGARARGFRVTLRTKALNNATEPEEISGTRSLPPRPQ